MFLMVPLEKTLLVPYCNQSLARLLESCDQRPDPRSLCLIWVSGVVTQSPEDGSEDKSRVPRVLCRSFPGSSNLGHMSSESSLGSFWIHMLARPQSMCPGAVAAEGQPVHDYLSFSLRWQTLNYCHWEPCIPGSSQPLVTAWQMISS